MKLRSLHIESHRQLENIDFDFTYPKNHPNSGKTLEKICIIGQSATGKTSILELIKNSILHLNSIELLNGNCLMPNYEQNFNGEIEFEYEGGLLKLAGESVVKNNRIINGTSSDMGGGILEKLVHTDLKVVYLSSEIVSRNAIDIFSQNPANLDSQSEVAVSRLQSLNKDNVVVFEFGAEANKSNWLNLLSEILEYRKRFTQMASELINKGAIADTKKLSSQYDQWAEKNKNPLIPFAEKFNPILKKLNLEIDLINTEYPIPVKSLSKNEIIPFQGLSTGTKNLLFSMFSLYAIDSSEAIVLIDEPERSLFPDIQIDLMQHYQNLASKAQIIVATHSPFIAAAFEPEERFILYFDEKGDVAIRRGEAPKGDDPNDMLRNDFNVDYYNEFGKQAYQKYLNLKKKTKQETEPERKKELIIELASLGDKYNF